MDNYVLCLNTVLLFSFLFLIIRLEKKIETVNQKLKRISHQISCSDSTIKKVGFEGKAIEERPSRDTSSTIREYNSEEYSRLLSLAAQYESDPSYFQNSATLASETEGSIQQRRNGKRNRLILGEDSYGSYFIIRYESQLTVFPSLDIDINRYNLFTVSEIFECKNYHEDYSEYTLLLPALGEEYSHRQWVISKRGLLEFS